MCLSLENSRIAIDATIEDSLSLGMIRVKRIVLNSLLLYSIVLRTSTALSHSRHAQSISKSDFLRQSIGLCPSLTPRKEANRLFDTRFSTSRVNGEAEAGVTPRSSQSQITQAYPLGIALVFDSLREAATRAPLSARLLILT